MTAGAPKETANDRWKRKFTNWYWGALILATLGHAALFAASPSFHIDDVTFGVSDVELVEIPDEIEIPPPPEDIARPPTPVVADVDFNEDLTIPLTTFEANPAETLPPPPSSHDAGALAAAPTFTPMTVRPQLLNPNEVVRAMTANYPPLLEEAGIGGTVHVWFFIDETGSVRRTLVHTGSGYEAFDVVALQLARVMRFEPAYNFDRAVPVWVSIPVVFEAD